MEGMDIKKKNLAPLISAFLFYAASIYCFMWAASSFSLSFTVCNGESSIFHEIPRCRWPSIAGIGFWGFGILGFALLSVCIYRMVKKNGENT
ncbi:hypothetical protein KCM76_14490 [Zooshikella marina]|uniref:hypothetical protein n=1 Tax=Zooshikella ganghwensis TaxID=202772 RepID=UPI001BAF9E32|nr:hypothetical protein [Zooshikella ganghwensis]MBU2707202.1 hypothetical protein [Zooshikella ganghwensis]